MTACQVMLSSGFTLEVACMRWAMPHAQLTLTCGSRSKQIKKVGNITPTLSATLMTCWWIPITPSASQTGITVFSHLSLTWPTHLRYILVQSLRVRPLRMVPWPGVCHPPNMFNKLLGMSKNTSRLISKDGVPCHSKGTPFSCCLASKVVFILLLEPTVVTY